MSHPRALLPGSLFALSLSALLLTASVQAATLTAEFHQPGGAPLADAVLTLRGPAGQPGTVLKADMDQRNQQFAPHVLAVHTGTAIKFPNSDNIRHQVYSFSPAKRFELRLYEGTPSDPITFDKPGVVVLGCNIHDWMLGYVYVTDDPRFAVSDAQGKLKLDDLPPGDYQLTLWHPQLADMQAQDAGTLNVPAGGVDKSFELKLDGPVVDLPSAPAPNAFSDAFNRAARETSK